MDADGGNQTRLTENTATDQAARFTADGRKLLFSSDRDGNHEIYIMNADGSEQTRLTNDAAIDFSPAVAVDGYDGTSFCSTALFVWSIDAPEIPQVVENISIGSFSPLELDGDYVLYQLSRDFDDVAALINIADGTVMQFNDEPSPNDSEVALAGGRFAFLLAREDADQEGGNRFRSAIGSVSDAPSATLADQLATYALRPSIVDNSTSPPGAEIPCAEPNKRIGYGSSFCITPDGSRTFLANRGFIIPQYDYVQMSTAGAFEDLPDPEGTTTTGSLIGTDLVCNDEFLAFRGLRQFGMGSGCFLRDDMVLSFIVLDRLK